MYQLYRINLNVDNVIENDRKLLKNEAKCNFNVNSDIV